jgi:hypothetical protein
MTNLPTVGELLTRIDALTARLATGDEITRIRTRRLLDGTRADLTRARVADRTHRDPYVGSGADGARRSAEIDRTEADCLDRTDPRYGRLLESAADWDAQAAELDR